MKLPVQVVLHADDDTEAVVRAVFTLQREQPLAPDTLGLQLGEAKDLLAAVQDTLVEHQVAAALSAQVECPECGLPRRHKDSRPIVVRTLFGRLRLDSPRWWHCGCSPRAALTFSPLASILPERTTPELSYLQARFAGLVSYGLFADLLGALLSVGSGTARQHGALAGAGHRAASGGRARRGASSTAVNETVRSFPDRSCRWSWAWTAATCTLRPAQPPRRLVRSDRRQGRARRGPGELFRLRADLRHQAETPAV